MTSSTTVSSRELVVIACGGATTVQDLGRPHAGSLGLSRSGAIDPVALRRANRLVGGTGDEAGLEVGPFGATLAFPTGALVAVCGDARDVRVGAVTATTEAPLHVPPGGGLLVGPARRAVYVYVAVAGGIDVPRQAGSRATDTLSGLGPRQIGAGDRLPIGAPGPGRVLVDLAVPVVAPGGTDGGTVPVRVTPGPRLTRFADDAFTALCATAWRVGDQMSRVGVRLEGPPLGRRDLIEVDPEPMLPGWVQVPPDGRPVVLLRDHGVTGGYPVVACVHPDDVRLVGQTPPGGTVRFRPDRTFVGGHSPLFP